MTAVVNSIQTMLSRAQIFHTHISVATLLPTQAGPVLCGPYPTDTDAFKTSPIGCGHHLHVDEGVQALTYFNGKERVTFLLDVWSDSTRGLLASARERGFVILALAGPTDNLNYLPGQGDFWQQALVSLDHYRMTTHRRAASDFLRSAFEPDVIAYHAVHPNDAKRLAGPIPGSVSLTVLLAPEHTAALER